MPQSDLERRLQRLRVREPDPAFMQGLRQRVRAQLPPGRPWWHVERLVLVNGGLLAAIAVLLVLRPGERASPWTLGPAPQVAHIDTVRQTVNPLAMTLMGRLEARWAPAAHHNNPEEE